MIIHASGGQTHVLFTIPNCHLMQIKSPQERTVLETSKPKHHICSKALYHVSTLVLHRSR